MEPLSWTGATGAFLNPFILISAACLVFALIIQFVMSFFAAPMTLQSNADGSLMKRGGISSGIENVANVAFLAVIAAAVLYLVAGVLAPYGQAGIIGVMAKRLLPVWIALIVTFSLSIYFKRKLGLYGKLFDSTVGMIGFGLVMFWVFTAIFAGGFDMLITHDPLGQVSGLKNKSPRCAHARRKHWRLAALPAWRRQPRARYL